MHYWVDLQSVQRFHCCDNIVPNAKCQPVPVLALRLVFQTSVVILNMMSVSTCCLLHLATTADTGVTGSSRDSTYKIGNKKTVITSFGFCSTGYIFCCLLGQAISQLCQTTEFDNVRHCLRLSMDTQVKVGLSPSLPAATAMTLRSVEAIQERP